MITDYSLSISTVIVDSGCTLINFHTREILAHNLIVEYKMMREPFRFPQEHNQIAAFAFSIETWSKW